MSLSLLSAPKQKLLMWQLLLLVPHASELGLESPVSGLKLHGKALLGQPEAVRSRRGCPGRCWPCMRGEDG